MILIIRDPVTTAQVSEMLETLSSYIKLAVGEVRFESLINIRPRQGNRGLAIQSPELRQRVERIVRQAFEGG
jgi:hypothetical protein